MGLLPLGWHRGLVSNPVATRSRLSGHGTDYSLRRQTRFGFGSSGVVGDPLAEGALGLYDLYPFAVGITAFAFFPMLFVWGGGI